jgi:hypothetical protein
LPSNDLTIDRWWNVKCAGQDAKEDSEGGRQLFPEGNIISKGTIRPSEDDSTQIHMDVDSVRAVIGLPGRQKGGLENFAEDVSIAVNGVKGVIGSGMLRPSSTANFTRI